MKAILIKGGRIIDPARGIDETADLLISGKKISAMGHGLEAPAGAEVLSADKLIVCPGFIDLHCHLREPGFEDKETIATGTLAAARGGFTTVCAMPNTSPPLDSEAVVKSVREKAEAAGPVRVLVIGCVSRGRKGEVLAEMGELASAGAIAFSDDGNTVASHLMRPALEYSLALGLPVIDHCEDTALSADGQMNEGIIATRLGLKGIPAAAEEAIVARDLSLAQLTGGRLHIAHVSTAGSVELIRHAQEKDIKVTAEVTPHHLTLTDEAVIGYNTSAKVNPPLRTARDIEALIQGLKDGTISAIATDHAPHTGTDKLCEFALAPSGISGLETALGSLMVLVHSGALNLITLLGKLTDGPAKIIGRDGELGTLATGASADVTIFNPDLEWLVDTGAFASKGKNTPLAGVTLKGKVVATIAQGQLVYRDGSVSL
ncbi:MAG: dihydroorotase [Chloroflexota bacterium]